MSILYSLEIISRSKYFHKDECESEKEIVVDQRLSEYLKAVNAVAGCCGFSIEISGNPIHFFGLCDIDRSNQGYLGDDWDDRIVLADEGGYPVSFNLIDGRIYYSSRVAQGKKISWLHVEIADSLNIFCKNLSEIIESLAEGKTLSTILPTTPLEEWKNWLGFEIV